MAKKYALSKQVEQVFNLIACDRVQGITELLGMLQALVKVCQYHYTQQQTYVG